MQETVSIKVLREFFSGVKPLTTAELTEFRKTDPQGYTEVKKLVAAAR